MKKVRLKSVKGPAFVKQEWHIKKNLNSKGSFAQEPYITGANLERAERYLRFLEQERDRKHWEYMKSGKKLHEVLLKNALIRWNTARTLFQILTGSEEVSRRTAEGACEK